MLCIKRSNMNIKFESLILPKRISKPLSHHWSSLEERNIGELISLIEHEKHNAPSKMLNSFDPENAFVLFGGKKNRALTTLVHHKSKSQRHVIISKLLGVLFHENKRKHIKNDYYYLYEYAFLLSIFNLPLASFNLVEREEWSNDMKI